MTAPKPEVLHTIQFKGVGDKAWQNASGHRGLTDSEAMDIADQIRATKGKGAQTRVNKQTLSYTPVVSAPKEVTLKTPVARGRGKAAAAPKSYDFTKPMKKAK